MMTAPKNTNKPYARLIQMLSESVSFLPSFPFDVYDIAAICVRETMGVPFFCKCDSLYKTNLHALLVTTGLREKEFIDEIIVKTELNRNQIPKFRFESSWFKLVRADREYGRFPLAQQAVYACSVGLGQKSVYYLMKNRDTTGGAEYLAAFMSDPRMQAMQVAYDYAGCMKQAHGDKALAFTMYNQGGGAHRVSEYGERCQHLADFLRLQHLKTS